MKNIMSLTKRNLLLFFRDKAAVFFSFLSVIIILGLYILFLSDVQVLNIKQVVGEAEGIKPLVNSWVMAGLIAVSSVTLSLGALGRIVADRENNSINDFLVAPIKREQVFISYLFSTLIITMLLSLVLIVIAEIYIVSSGGVLLTIVQALKVLGITILCTISSSLLMLFIVSYLKSEQSLGIFSTIVGTMIGFITGAYIPMGIMPKGIQLISNIIPVSQGASLLRKVFLEHPIKEVFTNAEALKEYSKLQGIDLYLGSFELTPIFMIVMIILSIVIFSILNIIRFKRMKNK
ncbi:MAG TPA: ABC transporter permease [Mollicutes bacterium]|nr:ABC transporter permease [Mollicutes bacterium]